MASLPASSIHKKSADLLRRGLLKLIQEWRKHADNTASPLVAAEAAQRGNFDATLNARAVSEGLGGLHVLPDHMLRVRSDGNCLLDTLMLLHHMADHQMQPLPLEQRGAAAAALRQQIVAWLRLPNSPAFLADGVQLHLQALAFQQYASWSDMCTDFARDGVFLENAAIQAAACVLERDIFVLNTQLSGVFSFWASGNPAQPAQREALYIGNWAMLHYVPMHFASSFASIQDGQKSAAPLAAGGAAKPLGKPASSEEQRALLDALNPELLATIPEIGDEAVSEMMKLRREFTVLLLGFMGSGKTSLINALIGEPVMPLAEEGDVKAQTDTLCLVEFWNDPHMPEGEYSIDITFKDNKTWSKDWAAFLGTVTDQHFRISTPARRDANMMEDSGFGGDDDFGAPPAQQANAAPEYGARYGTDMLLALHKVCFEAGAAGDAERLKVLNYLRGVTTDLQLSNDAKIATVRARGRIELKLKSVQLVSDLLSRLCRAFSSEDQACEQRLHSAPECQDVQELLQLGEVWPLIRIISVRANARNGEIPPFCRLIDSPGLGVDESVTGIDTLPMIQRALHDRQLTEVWYVQSYERNIGSKTFRDDMKRLKTSMGLAGVRFVITKSDVQMKNQVEPEHYSKELNTKVTDIVTAADMKSEEERKTVQLRTHFVSAQGYAYHRGWKWFPGVESRAAVLAKHVPTVTLSRVGFLFKHLRISVWDQVMLMHEQFGSVVSSTLASLCAQLAAPQQNASEGSAAAAATAQTHSCHAILKHKAVKGAQTALSRTVDTFVRHVRTFRLAPDDQATVIRHAEQQLRDLMSQTVKAILVRGGRFKNIDIGEVVWDAMLHAPATVDFPEAVQGLFQHVREDGIKAIDAFLLIFQELSPSSAAVSDVAKRKEYSRLAADLARRRQALTVQVTVADTMQELPGFARIWRHALTEYEDAPRNEKARTAITFVTDQLTQRLDVLVAKAVKGWLRIVKADMLTAVSSALEHLAEELDTQLQHHSTASAATLLALATSPARFWLSSAMLHRAAAVLGQINTAAPAPASSTPSVALEPDHRWVRSNIQLAGWLSAVDSMLLFRGLAAVDESDLEVYPAPMLLVPHQELLSVLAVPPADATASLADALASCSSAAILEALLSARTPALDARTLADQSDEVQAELAGSTQQQLQELSAAAVRSAATKIRFALDACDTLPENSVDQRTWKRFLKEWKKKQTVDINRQEAYSQNTKRFMEMAALYLSQHTQGTAQGPECPLGALDGGTEIQAWFYWRWLMDAGPLLLPHMHHAARLLHVNPMVSMSQNLEHALRYAAGLKSYRTAQEVGRSLHIAYNADLTPQLHADTQRPPILGVVVVFAVPAHFVRTQPKLHVVMQLLEQKKLKLSSRIASEEEVTYYGGMPEAESRVLLRWPLRLPNLSMLNQELLDLYGVNNIKHRAWKKLRELAMAIHANPDDDDCQRRFRAGLAVAAGHAICAMIDNLFHVTIGFDPSIVKNIR